jgi:hypothetical protein
MGIDDHSANGKSQAPTGTVHGAAEGRVLIEDLFQLLWVDSSPSVGDIDAVAGGGVEQSNFDQTSRADGTAANGD